MATHLRAVNVSRETELAARLEAADGLWARFMGLMGRASIDSDAGLWLSGTNGIHMMFMRFAIDAVFLAKPDQGTDDGVRRVLSVHRGLRAWIGIVPFVRGANSVLELPVGTIERTGTVVGDLVAIDPLTPAAGSSA